MRTVAPSTAAAAAARSSVSQRRAAAPLGEGTWLRASTHPRGSDDEALRGRAPKPWRPRPRCSPPARQALRCGWPVQALGGRRGGAEAEMGRLRAHASRCASSADAGMLAGRLALALRGRDVGRVHDGVAVRGTASGPDSDELDDYGWRLPADAACLVTPPAPASTWARTCPS